MSLGMARFVAAVFAAAFVGVAHAQVVSLAGPSTVAVQQEGEFRGANYSPNTWVMVVAKSADGLEQAQQVIVSDSGTMAYVFRPVTEGLYVVTVMDASGNELASATVAVSP